MARPKKNNSVAIRVTPDLAGRIKAITEGKLDWHAYLVEFHYGSQNQIGGIYGDPVSACENAFMFYDKPGEHVPVTISEFSGHGITGSIYYSQNENGQSNVQLLPPISKEFEQAFDNIYMAKNL